MKKKGYKGRCEKRSLSKCVGVCRTYSDLQSAYADVLEADPQVKEFQCNVLLEGLSIGEYTTDFLCTMLHGYLAVEPLPGSSTVRSSKSRKKKAEKEPEKVESDEALIVSLAQKAKSEGTSMADLLLQRNLLEEVAI